MNSDQFWTGSDGQILQVKRKGAHTLALTLEFRPRHADELEFLRAHRTRLHFTERSTLARIGIEMMPQGAPVIEGGRLLLAADAFIFDPSFPSAVFFKQLLRPGVPVGRLFYAPDAAKLSSTEIWKAVQENRLKLPSTISIDRLGRVFLTPHQVRYTLNPRLQRPQFERMVSGEAGRGYLDKVQVRHETGLLSIPPRSGLLTSCSMYLKEHYVVLNRGEGNFGIHTGAVVEHLLRSKPHPEQGYRACLGLLNLSREYGDGRLEAASALAVRLGSPNRRSVKSILESGRDLRRSEALDLDLPIHGNVRGPGYYH